MKARGRGAIVKIMEALGITGPVQRIVIECDVRSAVTVYVKRLVEAEQMDGIVDALREGVDIREVADVEVHADTSVQAEYPTPSEFDAAVKAAWNSERFFSMPAGRHVVKLPGPLSSEDAAAIKDALVGHIRNMNAAFEASNPEPSIMEQATAAIGPETPEPAILRQCAACAYRPCEPDSNLCSRCLEQEKR